MLKKSVLNLLLVSGLGLSTLTGCTWLAAWPPTDEGDVFTPQTAQVAPAGTVVQTAEGTWLQMPAQQQAVPVQSQEQRMLALQQAEKERDAALARLGALEKQMAEMQANMETLVPAMNNLAKSQNELQQNMQAQKVAEAQMAAKKASEKAAAQQAAMQEFNNTMQQHAAMNGRNAGAINPQPGAQSDIIMGDGNSVTTAPQALAANPQVRQLPSAAGVQVKDFRAGDGTDRTRLVFETTGKVQYDYDLDNGEGLMVLTLPGVHWSALPEKVFGQQSLLSSYKTVKNPDGGTSIVMQLRRPVKVEWVQMFEPSAGTPPRLIVDLAAVQ